MKKVIHKGIKDPIEVPDEVAKNLVTKSRRDKARKIENNDWNYYQEPEKKQPKKKEVEK